ncbi:MAG: hypothetical protein IH880_07640 [Candidatus Marinimicrobia bacterium]|nr:hypothetical protein [Candidatus Neomarinimicrobiota bacterium]
MSAKYLPILSLLFVSCSLFGDEPESTDYANVWDTESRDYKKPETILTDVPNSYIKEHTVVFKWRSTRTGPPHVPDYVDTTEYVNIKWSYRLNDGTFTDSVAIDSVKFTFLTDTLNIFEVRTHYPNGEVEFPPTRYEFRVDNIDGISLRFHPRKFDVARVGEPFIMEIYAEEVDSLTGAKIVLEYSPDSLKIESARAPVDENNILLKNGGTALFMDPILPDASGTITLNMAVAGAPPYFVKGTGKLAVLTLVPLLPGRSLIKFSSESTYRSFDNRDITIVNRVDGIIIAE